MILARLIERVEVGKGYQINIKFLVSLDDFIRLETTEKAS